MGSQRVRHDWGTELNWTELNWKQWVLHGPTPNMPPRVDSQLRDMKNGPWVPRKPSGGDQARYWPRVLSVPEALLFRGLLWALWLQVGTPCFHLFYAHAGSEYPDRLWDLQAIILWLDGRNGGRTVISLLLTPPRPQLHLQGRRGGAGWVLGTTSAAWGTLSPD